nr:MAG TPA: hypothetical protein [Caudoviricetes sp.]
MNVYDQITVDKHVVCESSLLKATITGHIYSLKMIANTDNGSIVSRGDWVEDQIFNAKAYAAGEQPLLVLTPPYGYNSDRRSYQDECNFYNATGEVARAYELCEGDIFTVSSDAITALSEAPVLKNYVSVSNGLYQEAATPGQTGFVGQIIEKVNYTNSVSYRILVVKTGV